MKNILVSAYACEPFKGSEQGVGWNYVLQLAKKNKVHVVTRSNNELHIEANIPEGVRCNLKFYYYDTNNLFKRLKNKSKGIHIYYVLWQIGVFTLLKNLEHRNKYDFAVHLTFGNVWLPTLMPFLNIPFIWGPIGGGESVPRSFITSLSWKQKLLQIARYFLKYTVYINPLLIFSAYKAKYILCRTQNTLDIFPSIFKNKLRIIYDGAIENDILKYSKKRTISKKIRLISSSRLIGYKNVISIIYAFSLLPDNLDIDCLIIGDGPEKNKIKSLTKRFNLTSKIKFKEGLCRAEVLSELENSDIFISPSMRDACNLSLLEAMAVGLPVICMNWSGMSLSTDENCAIRINVSKPEVFHKDLAKAIIKLATDENLRSKMGEAGRKRIIEEFNWDNKGLLLDKIISE